MEKDGNESATNALKFYTSPVAPTGKRKKRLTSVDAHGRRPGKTGSCHGRTDSQLWKSRIWAPAIQLVLHGDESGFGREKAMQCELADIHPQRGRYTT